MLRLLLLPARIVYRVLARGDGRPRRLGACAFCHNVVYAGTPHLRYRGELYHAEPCAEYRPPAEAYRQRPPRGRMTRLLRGPG